MDGLLLRPMGVADAHLVRQLVLDGLAERWGALEPGRNADLDALTAAYPDGLTVTAWYGGRLVGTGTLARRASGVREVVRMSTAADVRGRGVASAVLAALLEAAGEAPVVLETTATWLDARRLYERRGFVLDRVEDGDAHYRLLTRGLPTASGTQEGADVTR